MPVYHIFGVFVIVVVASVSADDLGLGFEPYDRQCGNNVCKGPMEYCDYPASPNEHPVCSYCVKYCEHVKSEIPQGCNEYCAIKNGEVMFVKKHKVTLTKFNHREKSCNETVKQQKGKIGQMLARNTNLEMERTVFIIFLSLTIIVIIILVIVIVVLCLQLRRKAVKHNPYKRMDTSSRSALNFDESDEMIKDNGQRGVSSNFHTNTENNHNHNRESNSKFVFSNCRSKEYLPNIDERPVVEPAVDIGQGGDSIYGHDDGSLPGHI